jgi:hypothetical protein
VLDESRRNLRSGTGRHEKSWRSARWKPFDGRTQALRGATAEQGYAAGITVQVDEVGYSSGRHGRDSGATDQGAVGEAG